MAREARRPPPHAPLGAAHVGPLALRAGKSVRWIGEQLGHADPAFTLCIHAHVLSDEGEDLGFLGFGASCSASNSMTTAPGGGVVKLPAKSGE